VRKQIGGLAIPDYIVITPSLPKTRSGKIMRRILRKIAAGETTPKDLGDTTTLTDPDALTNLIKKVELIKKSHKVQNCNKTVVLHVMSIPYFTNKLLSPNINL